MNYIIAKLIISILGTQMKFQSRHIGVFLLLLMLVGCTTSVSAPPPPPPPDLMSSTATSASTTGKGDVMNAHEQHDNPSLQSISLVRYITVDRSSWIGADPHKNATDGKLTVDHTINSNLSDMYMRINVSYSSSVTGHANESCDKYCRDYEAERRGFLARLLSSDTKSVTAIANIEITNPELKVAVPLFSITHNSQRDLGEVFNTNLTASNARTPLFRVGPNTAMTLHVNEKISNDLKSQAASLVLRAVQTAIKITVPTSPLLDPLSKDEVNNAAQAIDTTVSGLFSQDITEDIEVGRFTDTWNQNAVISLQAVVPTGYAKTQGQTADQDYQVGTWHVSLRCPRLSAFDPQEFCEGLPSEKDKTNVASRVSDAQVLQFSLSSQVTLQDFVQKQSWYTDFIKADKKDAKLFCGNSLMTFYANGLSQFDSALAMRAVTRRLSGIATSGTDWEKSCGDLIKNESVKL